MLHHLTAELMTEDDLLMCAHQPVVTDLGTDVRKFVRVMTGVQVRAADSAPGHTDQQLRAARVWAPWHVGPSLALRGIVQPLTELALALRPGAVRRMLELARED